MDSQPSFPPLPSLSEVLGTLRELGVSVPPGRATVTAYGDSAAMSADLLQLIISGKKRAGTALVWALEADEEPASEVGDLEIVLHFDGTPALLTRVTSGIVMPFNAVSAEYAAIEGEGDGSLEYWREAHWEFFSRECERIGLEPRVDMPVSCMTFELVEVIAEPRQR